MEIHLTSARDAYGGGNTVGISGSEETSRRGSRTGSAPVQQPQGDTVRVSQDAHLLNVALREAQAAPDMRAEKIEQIRQQIADGTYQTDSRRIAAGLLKEGSALFGKL